MYEKKDITITIRISQQENERLERYINKLNENKYYNKYTKSKVIRNIINNIDLSNQEM